MGCSPRFPPAASRDTNRRTQVKSRREPHNCQINTSWHNRTYCCDSQRHPLSTDRTFQAAPPRPVARWWRAHSRCSSRGGCSPVFQISWLLSICLASSTLSTLKRLLISFLNNKNLSEVVIKRVFIYLWD